MALPLVTLPRGLPPAWLSTGHGVELQPLYVDTPMSTGQARKRRVYRTAPRVVTVGLFLTAAQTRDFFNWYEGPLMRAGAEAFSVRLPDQGPRGLLWWHARFVEPPTYEAHPRGHWRVTAKLLLTGQGSTEPPPVPELSASITFAVTATGGLSVGKPLAADITAAWLPSLSLAADVTAAWLPAAPTRLALAAQITAAWLPAAAVAVPASHVLREDGGFMLREDGGRVMREA